MRHIFVAAVLSTLLVQAGFSQKQDRKRVEDKSHAVKIAGPARSEPTRTMQSETFTSLAIPAGQSVAINSGMDYTDCDVVRISLRSAALDLSNLQLMAYWSDPMLGFFNGTEAIDGSTFVYSNTGGAQFFVYGPEFRLVLTNTGTATVTVEQLMLFAPVTFRPFLAVK